MYETSINSPKPRAIALLPILVFLVIFIVQIVIGLVAPHNEESSMWDCVDCFINGDC